MTTIDTLGRTLVLLAATSLTAGTAAAAIQITTEHADVGIAYESGSWDLHVHDEDNDLEYEPSEAVFVAGPASKTTAPNNPLYNFLGAPGSDVWILPQGQNPLLPFLGIAAEEIDPGVFVNDRVSLTLSQVNGPGEFALYQTDSFGLPTVFMNTRDGITVGDLYQAIVGSHAHFNWAFSAPGEYEIAFEASGILNDGLNTPTSSWPVAYNFTVVPEPSQMALLAGGGLVLATMLRQRRKNSASAPTTTPSNA